MKIESGIFEIENQKPTLEFLESWFKDNNLDVIRYAIVKSKNGILTIEASYIKHST